MNVGWILHTLEYGILFRVQDIGVIRLPDRDLPFKIGVLAVSLGSHSRRLGSEKYLLLYYEDSEYIYWRSCTLATRVFMVIMMKIRPGGGRKRGSHACINFKTYINRVFEAHLPHRVSMIKSGL